MGFPHLRSFSLLFLREFVGLLNLCPLIQVRAMFKYIETDGSKLWNYYCRNGYISEVRLKLFATILVYREQGFATPTAIRSRRLGVNWCAWCAFTVPPERHLLRIRTKYTSLLADKKYSYK